MAKINLEGMDKAEVLAVLYNASKPQGMGFMQYNPAPMTVEEARQLLEQSTYFDYLCGRVMKIDLSGDVLDTWGYDRDNGVGAAEKAINTAVQSHDVNNAEIHETHQRATNDSADELEGHLDEETTFQGGKHGGTMHLGYSDVAKHLRPKIDDARRANPRG